MQYSINGILETNYDSGEQAYVFNELNLIGIPGIILIIHWKGDLSWLWHLLLKVLRLLQKIVHIFLWETMNTIYIFSIKISLNIFKIP